MSDARIYDSRKVEITDLPEGCTSYTPAGRVAIRCISAEIHYDITTGHLRAVYVRGELIHDRDIQRRAATLRSGSQEARLGRARGTIERSYRLDWRTHTADVPPWLARLIEEFRPAVTS
jgi:hypothetical protein